MGAMDEWRVEILWDPYEICDIRSLTTESPALDLNHGNLEKICPHDSTEYEQCSEVNVQYRITCLTPPLEFNTYAKFVNMGADAPMNPL